MDTKFYITVDSNDNVTGILSMRGPHPTQSGTEVTRASFEEIQNNPDEQYRYSNGVLSHVPKVIPVDEARRMEYPDVGEQLGAIINGLKKLFVDAGITPDTDTQALFDAVQAIKERHPKIV